jgi:hypothetical protein
VNSRNCRPTPWSATCRARCWHSGVTNEEIGLAGGTELLASGLDRHGLQHVSFPDHDHEGMLAHINDAVPNLLAWLDQL